MTNEELLGRAKEGMRHAYAPYSGFCVGAALLCRDGRVFTGCNIENASYGATVCAERTAIWKAVSEGCTELERLAVVCSAGTYAYPCGICRQVMAEFMPEGTVILEDKKKGICEFSVEELMPGAFTRKDLFHDETN